MPSQLNSLAMGMCDTCNRSFNWLWCLAANASGNKACTHLGCGGEVDTDLSFGGLQRTGEAVKGFEDKWSELGENYPHIRRTLPHAETWTMPFPAKVSPSLFFAPLSISLHLTVTAVFARLPRTRAVFGISPERMLASPRCPIGVRTV